MPRLQTFEGDGLEAVLARVKSEAGPNARVLEAKKVRDGGLGGFFSKERFVLTVEVPDAPAKRPRPRPQPEQPAPELSTAPPSSILELADLMNETEARETFTEPPRPLSRPAAVAQPAPIAPAAAPLPRPAAVAAPAPLHLARPAPTGPAAHIGFEALPLVPTERAPDPMPSTETQSFHDVLARLAAEMPATDEQIVEDIDVATLGFEPINVDDIDTLDLDDYVEVAPVLDDTEQAPAPVLDDTTSTAEPVEESAQEEVAVHPAIIDEPETLPAVPAAPSLIRVRRTPSEFERTIGMGLLELGVPAAYVPDIDGAFTRADVRDAIRTALRLPKPPALPLRNNAIVAVVGERRAAIHLADQLADEPSLNGAIVKVADRQGFTLIDGGAPMADEKGRRSRPNRTIVAVPSTPGQTADWTRQLLDDLEPDMVWGVVPAARKSEDIAAWAIGLGGLDVLALTGIDKTVSPATALRLGIPIGLLDGANATVDAWADLLTARLAA